MGVNRQSVSTYHPHICKCIQYLHVHKGHRYLIFGKERQRKIIIHKTMKKVKPRLKANPDRSLIGALICLRTAAPMFSHGGERLTIPPCAGGEWSRWEGGGRLTFIDWWKVVMAASAWAMQQCRPIQLIINCSNHALCTLCRKWEWLILNKSIWAGNYMSLRWTERESQVQSDSGS